MKRDCSASLVSPHSCLSMPLHILMPVHHNQPFCDCLAKSNLCASVLGWFCASLEAAREGKDLRQRNRGSWTEQDPSCLPLHFSEEQGGAAEHAGDTGFRQLLPAHA